jgi:hypothetical protein
MGDDYKDRGLYCMGERLSTAQTPIKELTRIIIIIIISKFNENMISLELPEGRIEDGLARRWK